MGVHINKTCYKTGRVRTRDFTVYSVALSKQPVNLFKQELKFGPFEFLEGIDVGPFAMPSCLLFLIKALQTLYNCFIISYLILQNEEPSLKIILKAF